MQESGSDEFDRFLRRLRSCAISRLTVVEFRCLMARRRRNRDMDADAERRVLSAFESDIGQGHLEVHPLDDRHAMAAADLLAMLNGIPLRTLDALHLAIARAINADGIATADRVLAAAAGALRLRVWRFGSARNFAARR